MSNPFESLTFGNSLSLRVDGAIGAMSLSPNGRDAVLAGRRGLFIIDLDDPFTTPRWLHHITSWEVADVQWSPHHALKPSWCISTSNQKALLWDLARPSNNAITNVLHRHTRAITDINFHPLDPEVLATCSIDTFILSWDMRTPRRPVAKWAEWRAGATQVKWNHNNPYQIASSHDHSFYLWDTRSGALPILKIDNAHQGKINGLDFSGGNNKIISCSNDKTIKLWDLQSTDTEIKPTIVIEADYPVARARCLPFGRDRSCGIMPLRGGDDSVHIVNYEALYKLAVASGETGYMKATPDYSFKGHDGSIKDFLWRTKHENYEGYENKQPWKEFQLVTWSSLDFDLKLWPHDEQLYDKVNYHPLHQTLLNLLANAAEDLASTSVVTTPQSDISEEAAFKQPTIYKYNTYCTEPPLSLGDLSKDFNGDLLSTLALFKIKQTQEHVDGSSQLNHLNWISGVRMGRMNGGRKGSTDGEDDEDVEQDGPNNLGEEVSIVGHKFPKLRFEKISVSTGHLVLTLRGPLPVVELTSDSPSLKEKDRKESTTEAANVSSTALKTSISGPASTSSGTSKNIPTVSSSSSGPDTTTSSTGVNPNIPTTNTKTAQAPASTSSAGQSESTPNTSVANTATDANQEQKLVFIRLEIKFPKMYPYLEDLTKHTKAKRTSRQKKSGLIKFDIEETHEVTPLIKERMIESLDEIAQFYCNKYNKFCLEPCLRHLMGDKIDLDDSLMLENNSNDENEEDYEIEVGNENWVDDLVDQHNAANIAMATSLASGDDEDDDDADLIPPIGDKLAASTEFLKGLENSELREPRNNIAEGIGHDSTPLPKGCGAVWSPTGQLVCFFIPKGTEQDDQSRQNLNVFKFTGNGFTLKAPHHHHLHQHSRSNSHNSRSVGSGSSSGEHDENDLSSSSEVDSDSDGDQCSSTSTSSDDSFSNDWDEMLQDDVPSRSRIPGIFKGSVGLGRRYLTDDKSKSSVKRTISAGGTGSNYKSSAHGEMATKSSKRNKKITKKGKNVVTIFDFKHLLPDKYDLACDYRVLGDTPEILARHNSEIARHYGHTEISDVWRIVEMILMKDIRLNEVPELGKDMLFGNAVEKGRYFWGNHPFAHSWLILELFKYFERSCNLQMLAMMSCILFENPANIKEGPNGSINVPIHTPYSVLPPTPSVVTMREYGLYHPELESSSIREPIFHNKLMESTPLARKGSSMSVRTDSFSRSIPNAYDHLQKSESPPRVGSLKKQMQGTVSSFVPFMENLGFPDPGSLRNSRSFDSTRRLSRTSLRKGFKGIPSKKGVPTISTMTAKWKQRAPPKFEITMKNMETLDLLEEMYTLSLLSGLDMNKIMSYREQYADMLFNWELPYHRIKTLKFNYADPKQHAADTSIFKTHNCSYGFRYRKALDPAELLLNSITPIKTAKNNAWNTRKRNMLQYCGLCDLLVTKRVVICTNCEHILHSDCATEWWSINDDDDEEGAQESECPTGCGCRCLEHKI